MKLKNGGVREGDMLARTIYDERGMILLKQGAKITAKIIDSLNQQGFKGIYVNHADKQRNQVSAIEPIIDDVTTLKMIALLKDCFQNQRIFDDAWDAEFIQKKKQLEKHIDSIYELFKAKKEKNELLFEIEDTRNQKNWIEYHSLATMKYSLAVMMLMGFDADTCKDIALAALFHDLGKAKYPDLISKRDITEEDKAKLKEHPRCMFEVMQSLGAGVHTRYAIWQHHERLDGSGYPNKIKGDTITVFGRIVGLASQYDNLISITPFNHSPMNPNDAIEVLMADQRFDTEIVRQLINIVAIYPIASKVKLSTGEVATILKNNYGLPTRPVILLGYKEIDLAHDENFRAVTITESVE
jgi:HD-GYP domain-containing protein (c-di-GMP phosphodiesterase class II)